MPAIPALRQSHVDVREAVIEFRPMFGRPDYFVRVAVADHAAYNLFLTSKLTGLPNILRVDSHLAMKKIKTDE